MKKNNLLSLKHFFLLALLIILQSLLACNPQKAEEKTASSTTTLPEQKGVEEAKPEGASMLNVDIHTAVLKNDIEAVKHHITAKSDLNVKEAMGGSTPLISAALFGRTEIAQLLIDAGAHLNIQNNDGSTAIGDKGERVGIMVYPNPVSTNGLLHVKIDKTDDWEIFLYDVSGRLIRKAAFKNQIAVSTTDLSKGVYFYQIKSPRFMKFDTIVLH